MSKMGRPKLDEDIVKSERIFVSLTKCEANALMQKSGCDRGTQALRVAALAYIDSQGE